MVENNNRGHINVQIEQKTKDDWKEFQEDHPEFETMSGMVRIAVQSYIEDSKAEDESTTAELEEVSDKLDTLKEDIQWLRKQNEQSIEAIAHDLYQTLVPLPADSEAGDAKAIQVVAFEDNQQTPTELAKKLDTTPKQIRNAVDYLRDHGFSITQYEMADGRLQFFKKQET